MFVKSSNLTKSPKILLLILADIMSEVNNIDMFKNDVRYRENIAHIETIPAKKASFKKVDNLIAKNEQKQQNLHPELFDDFRKEKAIDWVKALNVYKQMEKYVK